MKDESTSRTYKILFLSLMFIIVAGALTIFLNYHEYERALEEHYTNVLKVEEFPATPENIIGTYSVMVEQAGAETSYTGAIKEDSLGNPILTLYDEYEPRTLMLSINEDGSLYNDYLGQGIMRFKSNIGKIIITFEKEDTKCTLTR